MGKVKAIIYDYDGTLTPDVCPQFEILEKSGLEGGCSNPSFFRDVHARAKRDHIDVMDAMIRQILAIAGGGGYRLTDDNIALGADQREYRLGVSDFLQKVQSLGLHNYLLSSGSKAYLERTAIAPYFTTIYGSTLHYDENGEATGPDYVMTTEAKIDALREIAQSLNGSPEDCEGLVYIGDGPTDIPVMTYTKEHNGITILVQDPATQADVERQLQELASGANANDAITHRFPADFRDGSELDYFISSQI